MKRIYFKKVISIILTLCMLIPYVSSIEVKGATIFEQDYLKFEVITEPQGGENGTVNVSGNNTGATSIVIPETVTNNGKTYNVTEIKDAQNPKVIESFNLYTELVSIEIPDSITSIGNYAFAHCSKLTSIKLPNSITSIGEGAFMGCSSLANINLPASIISINSNTFSDCSSLKSINIPDTVTTINGYAFAFCSSLVSVKISTSTTSIGSGAFTGCSNLTSINLPASVSSINTVAFKNCTSLKDITILSNELETLANNSFSNINENARFYIVSEDIKNLLISKCKISADKIEMIDAPKSYSLKLNSNGSGTVSGDGIYKEGEKVTIKAIPNDGHKFDNWTVNSDNVILEDRTLTEITFTMPDANVKITANFSELAIDNVFSQGNLKFEVISEPSTIGNGKVRVSGNDKSAISIEIPKTVTNDKSTYDVIEIKRRAFDDYRSLTNIEIPDSITYIGDLAFDSCSNLISIKIPDSVTYIGDSAFGSCSRLTSVELSNSINSINSSMFHTCISLTHIKIPDSVTIIDNNAFTGCSNLINIDIPKSVISIGESVFIRCNNLESITILSEHLGDIYSTTFSNLSDKVRFYTVNENIKNLLIDVCGISADRIEIIDASKLYTLKLNYNANGTVSGSGSYMKGKTVTIEAIPDEGYKFNNWTVDSNNITLKDSTLAQTTFIMPAEDVVITANFSELTIGDTFIVDDLKYEIITLSQDGVNGTVNVSGNNKDATEIEIPETVINNGNIYTVIEIKGALDKNNNDKGGFEGYSQLTKIKLPNSITSIGDYAFHNCDDLRTINIPDSMTYIGNYAFASCNYLSYIKIPNLVTYIGDYAFRYCYNLSGLKLPNSVTYIGRNAFENCYWLTSISIPNSITRINENTFNFCSNLRSIEIPNSVTYIGEMAFYNCTGLTRIEIPSSVTHIMESAFLACTYFEDITILSDKLVNVSFNGITRNAKFHVVNNDIKNQLINECDISADRIEIIDASKLHTLKLNSNDNGTVSGSGIYMKGKTVTITATAKDGYKFDSWTVNSGNVTLEDSTSAQTTFIMPANNIEITANFVKIGETVETPNKDLIFNIITKPEGETNGTVSVTVNNKNLTSVYIPETIKDKDGNTYTVVEIEDNAFKDCNNLQHIKLPNTIITIGQGAFENCTNLIEITIPSGVTSIGDNAFKGCIILQIVVIISGNITIGKDAFTNVADNVIYITTNNDTKDKLKPFVKDENQIQVSDGNIKDTSSVIIRTSAGGTATGNGLYKSGDTVNLKATAKDGYKFDKWIVISGNIAIENINSETTSFTMPDKNVILMANFISNSGSSDNNVGDSFVTDDKFIVTVTKPAGSDTQGTVTIVGTTDTSGTITIPSTITDKNGKVYKITFVSDSAFTGNKNITSVIIQNGITSIGNGAFKDCVNLIHISIPDSVASIGDSAFENCTKLEKIDIPNSTTSIGNNAFKGCINIIHIIIPNSVIFIGNSAFENCTKLEKIEISNNITSIGNNVFKGCINLIHISIPDSVTSIGDGAFENCTKLEKIEIPSSVILIGNNAFKGCINLSKIIILTIKVIIKNNAFENISKDASFIVINQEIKNILIQIGIAENQIVISKELHKVTVKSDSNGEVTGSGTYSKDDTVTIKATPKYGYKFDKWTVTTGNVILADDKLPETTFTMPDEDVEVTANFVKDEVFIESKDNLDFIVQKPATENEEGEVTFKVKDKNVTYVTIPSKVKDNKGNTYVIKIIPNNAFEDCKNLKEIKIPETIISIGDSAFKGCTSLIEIVLPDTITIIGSNAFENCTSLIEITIPKNVELIKDNAFLNCTSLIKVIIFSLNLQIATNAFTGVSSTTKFIVLTVEVKTILILCHILEIQIIILDPELNLQEQIDKANELLMKNYPTLDELIQSTIDLSDGIVNYFQSK